MINKRAKNLDSQFLIRIIKNGVGAEEKEYFDSWLSQSDENKEEFGNLTLLWDKLEKIEVPPIPDSNIQWKSIQEKIFTANQLSVGQLKEITKKDFTQNDIRIMKYRFVRESYSWVLSLAAVIIMAIGLTFLLEVAESSNSDANISRTKGNSIERRELITKKGERKSCILADGSIVHLNAESKIVYPQTFSGSSREVELTGEAYFSVVTDKERSFKVFSGGTVTIVTGTEFNIKNRNNQVSIIVTKGSVKACLKGDTQGIELKKGEIISYNESKGFGKSVRADLQHYLAWRNNKFSFENTSIKDAIAEIERYYNLEIVYENKAILNKRLTGIFRTDSLNHIFSIISLTLDVQIDRQGRKVIIR
jgi:transmembrane sensor